MMTSVAASIASASAEIPAHHWRHEVHAVFVAPPQVLDWLGNDAALALPEIAAGLPVVAVLDEPTYSGQPLL